MAELRATSNTTAIESAPNVRSPDTISTLPPKATLSDTPEGPSNFSQHSHMTSQINILNQFHILNQLTIPELNSLYC